MQEFRSVRSALVTRASRIAFVGFAAAVLIVSLLPAPDSLPLQTGWDKADHVLAFAVLGLLGLLAWPARAARLLLSLAAFGGLIELLQGLTGYRTADGADLLADVIGLAFATLVFRGLRRFWPSGWWRMSGAERPLP